MVPDPAIVTFVAEYADTSACRCRFCIHGARSAPGGKRDRERERGRGRETEMQRGVDRGQPPGGAQTSEPRKHHTRATGKAGPPRTPLPPVATHGHPPISFG